MDSAAVAVVAEGNLDEDMQVGTGLGPIQEDSEQEKGVPTLISSPHNAPDTVVGPIEVSTATRPRCRERTHSKAPSNPPPKAFNTWLVTLSLLTMVQGGDGVVVNRAHTAPAKAHKTGFFEGDQPGVEWEEVELEGMTHMSQVQYYTGAQKTAEGGQEGGVHRRGPVRTGRGSDHSTGPASAQQPDQGTHWQIGTMAQKPQGDRWHNKGKGGEGEGAEEGAEGQGGQRQGHQRGDRRHTVLPHRSAYYAGNGEGELTPARTYSGEPGEETEGDALTEAAKLVRPGGKYLHTVLRE